MTPALQRAVDEALVWNTNYNSSSNNNNNNDTGGGGDDAQSVTSGAIARLHRRELQRRLGLRAPLATMFEGSGSGHHHQFDYMKSAQYTARDLAVFLAIERDN